MALHALRQSSDFEPAGLVTSVTEGYDRISIADLPPGVDPCGENGEFHTFVHAGPIFQGRVGWEEGRLEIRRPLPRSGGGLGRGR
jgi:diphthamide synthase (EF-2-diphthine--ammonia ligase)